MISIIVPAYNAEKTITRCIKSILEQSVRDFELLLIDDGSTDGTGEICDRFAEIDNRVKVFHKTNGGVSSARNLGLDNADGEWITFVDSDDYVDTEWLAIFNDRCTDYDMVVQGFICEGIAHPFPTCVTYKGDCPTGLSLLAKNEIVGYVWAKLFRHDIIKKNRLCFNKDFSIREDEDFILKYMSVSQSMICTPKAGYHYIVPDWSSKYKQQDNFYTLCSLFNSITVIYNNKFNCTWQKYLNDLDGALIFSFESHKSDRKHRVKIYQEYVGKTVLKSHINIMLKWILYIIKIPSIATYLFDLRTRFVSK